MEVGAWVLQLGVVGHRFMKRLVLPGCVLSALIGMMFPLAVGKALQGIVVAVHMRGVRRLRPVYILTRVAIFATGLAGRWLCRTLHPYRSQIFAPTEHFTAPVAVCVEMTMT
ncbi:hypothetical protein [Paraburkholderia sp.]|uniref:hypothetical protein n=1 Tax=Paraburkholderia sp. TaxID=1926495 RepID=UPI003C642A58